jgi:hypothetical protein
MPTLTNTTAATITLTTMHKMEPGETITVDDRTLARLKGEPRFGLQLVRGSIEVDRVIHTAPIPIAPKNKSEKKAESEND